MYREEWEGQQTEKPPWKPWEKSSALNMPGPAKTWSSVTGNKNICKRRLKFFILHPFSLESSGGYAPSEWVTKKGNEIRKQGLQHREEAQGTQRIMLEGSLRWRLGSISSSRDKQARAEQEAEGLAGTPPGQDGKEKLGDYMTGLTYWEGVYGCMKSLEKSNSYVHRKPSKSKDKAVLTPGKTNVYRKKMQP